MLSRSDFIGKRGILEKLACKVLYGGNPEHKKNPGDFGLTPPSSPRRGKSLCDDVGIFSRAVALHHLRNGMRMGLVEARWSDDGWPWAIWAVTDDEDVLEARYERQGSYHGYPMPQADPFREVVIEQWRLACVRA